ncbi:MAG: twin-arginine translocase TatA/TatE family subunit [Vicinamibacteria bacterium]
MFGSLGGPELFLIFVVGLVVFGPRKLPEIGKSLGKMIGEFKKASADFQRTVEEEVETEKLRKEISSADFTGNSPSPEVKPLPAPAPVIREAEGNIPVSSPLAALSEEPVSPPAAAVAAHEGEKS